MRMHFDLIDMQLLVNIAEEQSLTKGAERSFLSLPSASLRIKTFEETLGAKLLYRKKQGTTLTPVGETVLHHAKTVLAQLERLRGDLHEHSDGFKGHIRLYANATSISASLPDVLREYLARHPNVDITLREKLSDEGARAVADGSADIAIVSGDTPADGLELLPYCSEALVLATSAGHPLASRRAVDFSETLDFNYVGLQEGSAIYRFLTRQAQGLRKQLGFRIHAGSFETICRMIEADVGIGILPASAARRCARVMDIHVAALKDDWAVRQSMICARSVASLPLFTRTLIAMLTQAGDTRRSAEPGARKPSFGKGKP